MNCKPGDLALIVRTTNEKHFAALGRIVRCVALLPNPGDSWALDSPLIIPHPRGGFIQFRGVADACLRRIGDPGDDVQDETLQWLALPHSAGMVA